MHLCTQVAPFDEPLEDVFAFVSGLGIESLDINCNEWYSPPDIEPSDYLDDPDAQSELLALLDDYDLEISVLGATNNPLHPVDERAGLSDEQLRDTIRLADQLGVNTVTCFSGLPGGSAEDVTPNWLTSPVPTGQQMRAHAYQWEEVAIPYWRDLAEFADDHGVDVAIEIHINMLIDDPVELVRLRHETNDRIGAYVDPAHLTLQGIDPVETIRYLGAEDANFHFEASDVKFYEQNRRLKGFTDMTPMDDELGRSWLFCTVGYGHGDEYWRDIVSALHLVGYDGPVSIQQLHTPEPLHAGIGKAVDFLGPMLL